MAYVLKRKPVHYLDGKTAPDAWYKENLLGLTVLTSREGEAKQFPRKSEAQKQANALGGRFCVTKLTEE